MSVRVDLLDLRTWVTALVLLGFLPGFVLKQLVRIYPKGDPRRAELVAELYAIKNWLERPLFLAQQLETALTDGVPARLQGWRHRPARTNTHAAQMILVEVLLSHVVTTEFTLASVGLEDDRTASLRWRLGALKEHGRRRVFARWRAGAFRDDVLSALAAEVAELQHPCSGQRWM